MLPKAALPPSWRKRSVNASTPLWSAHLCLRDVRGIRSCLEEFEQAIARCRLRCEARLENGQTHHLRRRRGAPKGAPAHSPRATP